MLADFGHGPDGRRRGRYCPEGGREEDLKMRRPADLKMVKWDQPPEQGWKGQEAKETHRRRPG